MKKKYLEFIAGGGLILFALWGWYETSSWEVSDLHSGVHPAVYPRAVFTLIAICGGIILIRTLVKLLRKGGCKAAALEQVVTIRLVKVAATSALMVLYVMALQAFGFLFTTPVFLFLCMLLFGERKWIRMVIISIVGSAALYLFFVQLMRVRF